MMRLNLMPWRERQREAAIRRFRSQLIAGALLALCAVTLVDQLARQRGQQQAVANARAVRLAVEEHDRDAFSGAN